MYRVLLVDDEPRVIKDIEENIVWSKLGIRHVFKAQSAREAFDIYYKYHPEIIISDIEMSGNNGIDLLKKIREEDKKTYFLFLTCHCDFSYMQSAIRYGSCDYLLKPVDYEELTLVLKKIMCIDNNDSEKIQGSNKLIEDCKEYIADHLIDDMKVADLAKYVHCSEAHIMKLFRKNTGLSILEYITDKRMEKACELLRKTDWNINQISDMCGYQDSSYFTRVFKKQTGKLPSEYRKVVK